MMPLELLDICEQKSADDHNFIVLTIPYRRHKRRVRLFPGVLAEVVGSDAEKLVCSVQISDLLRFFVRHLSSIERLAVKLAEAGEDEEAARWFAQYTAVRDRLDAAGNMRAACGA